MNERILELAEQANKQIRHRICPNTFKPIDDPNGPHIRIEFDKEKFAELIVRECMSMCEETRAAYLKKCKASYDFKDKNIYAEGERASDIIKHKIKKRFGVEETPGWVCPNCGTDRTKAACPKGHTAALTGDCPMHGVAHGAAQ